MLVGREIGSDTLELRLDDGVLVGGDAAKALTDHLEKALMEQRHVLLNLHGCKDIDAEAVGILLKMEGRFHDGGTLDLLPFGAPRSIRERLQSAAEF